MRYYFKCKYQIGLNLEFIPLYADTLSDAEDCVLDIMNILNPHGWVDTIQYRKNN
jgi:hypothetical protein